MRGISWRLPVLGGLVLVPFVPFAVGADPDLPRPRPVAKSTGLPAPLPANLRADTEALAADRAEAAKDAPGDSVSAERAELNAQLKLLLKRLNDAPPGATVGRPTPPPPRPKFDVPAAGGILDGVRLAQNLFRDDEIDAALRAFRLIDTSQLTREDRAFVQYMTATCLRKLNKPAEAAAVYREVADAKDDEYIADCAVWQLSLLRSTQELEDQLEQLRAKSKNR